MTRDEFIQAYRTELLNRYEWAKNPDALNKFIESATHTIDGASTWNHSGPSTTAAWHAIGGKGKPSLKALRALP